MLKRPLVGQRPLSSASAARSPYHLDEETAGHLVNPVLHFADEKIKYGLRSCLVDPLITNGLHLHQHVVRTGKTLRRSRSWSRDCHCSPSASNMRPTILAVFSDRLDVRTKKLREEILKLIGGGRPQREEALPTGVFKLQPATPGTAL